MCGCVSLGETVIGEERRSKGEEKVNVQVLNIIFEDKHTSWKIHTHIWMCWVSRADRCDMKQDYLHSTEHEPSSPLLQVEL